MIVLSASLGHCLEMRNAKNEKNNQYIHQQMQGMDNTKKKGKMYIYEKVII